MPDCGIQLHETSIALSSRSYLGDCRTNLQHLPVPEITPLNYLVQLTFLQHLRRAQASKSPQDEKWQQIREFSVSCLQQFGKCFYWQDCRSCAHGFRSLYLVERIRNQHAFLASPREHR